MQPWLQRTHTYALNSGCNFAPEWPFMPRRTAVLSYCTCTVQYCKFTPHPCSLSPWVYCSSCLSLTRTFRQRLIRASVYSPLSRSPKLSYSLELAHTLFASSPYA